MAITLPRTRSCFVCGAENPFGLKLEFTAEKGRVRAAFRPRREHVGFQDTLHGGLTSTVLDEAMTWACGAGTGRFAYCAELTVRFLKPVRPENGYEVIGWLRENRRNRLLLAEAELREASGLVLASASGKYMPIAEEALAPMLSDFLGDPRAALAQIAEPPTSRVST
jgi:acyl-coenzyme A thioesterase PaaI-like protein